MKLCTLADHPTPTSVNDATKPPGPRLLAKPARGEFIIALWAEWNSSERPFVPAKPPNASTRAEAPIA